MESGRVDVDGGVAGAAAGQERRRWRGGAAGGCGDDEESSHESSGGVELSLRLRTGADDDDDRGGAAATSAPPPATLEARRNMTIFYNGRVCAVDVTEVQARAIISMASEETLQAADHRRRRRQRQQLMRGDGGGGRQQDADSSSSSTSAVARRRCAGDNGLVRSVAAPSLLTAGGVVGCPLQGGAAAVAAPVLEIDPAAASGLSMKRSLQLFLQKRKAKTAAAPSRRPTPPAAAS